MPTQLLLKGPNLQELLAQVRAEHGPAAKVVSAERVRGAGISGLFSGHRFELTVEVPDADADAGDLLSLIEQRENDSPDGPPAESAGGWYTGETFADVLANLRAQGAASATAAQQPPMPPLPVPPATPARDGEVGDDATIEFVPGPVFESVYERSIPALRPARSFMPDPGPTDTPESPDPTPTTATPPRATTAKTPRTTTATPPRATTTKTPRATAPKKASSATAKTTAAAPSKTSRAATAKTTAAAPSKASRAASSKATPAASSKTSSSAPPKTSSSAPPKTSRAATAKTTRPTARRTVPVAPVPPSAPAAPEAAVPAREPDAPAQPSVAQHALPAAAYVPHTAARPPRADLTRRLAVLGVPDRLLAALVDDEAYPAIVGAFAAVPTAAGLSAMPGEIIAVVGEPADARAVAEDVCRLLRLDASRIVTTGRSTVVDLYVTDPGDPDGRVNRLPGGDDPRVVVVDAPANGHGGGWARAVLEALRPDTIWAVVDPSRKTQDTARHLAGLGRVDGIAIHGTARTADPASPLALNLPVALLDGRPATPYAWAGMLCERLYERADHVAR